MGLISAFECMPHPSFVCTALCVLLCVCYYIAANAVAAIASTVATASFAPLSKVPSYSHFAVNSLNNPKPTG